MAVPLDKFIQQLEDSGIVAGDTLKDFIPPKASPTDAEDLAKELIRQKKLTKFQAEEISKGKGKSLTLGNYVLLEKIGAGGMGQVFKAEHRRMHRKVAIKLLPPAMTKDKAAIARFEREVTAAAKLRHPNIVAADDADCANGVHFLVMECVEGSDLSALVKKNGPFSVAQAINYILQAARGLEFAHSEGVVHRDIKPANLLLDKKGVVKILDMGLARLHGDGDSPQQADLTSTGTIMGTVDYMSPEQALDTKTADARADIYALGCSLFYLLTGKATYDGDTLMKKLVAHREQPIPLLRSVRGEVPETLESVFKKMVAKKLEDRYRTMTAVIHDLEGCSGRLSSTSVNGPKTTENAPFNSSPNTFDLQPTSSLQGTQPRQTIATLTAADVAAEATMLTGDSLQVTNPQTQSLAGSVAGRSSVVKQKSEPASWWKDRRIQIGGGLAGLLILMAGIVISLKTKHGTLIVDVDQPDAMVQVDDGERVQVIQKDGSGKVTISVDPGKHRIKVEKDGFTVFGQEFEMEKRGTKAITAKLVPVDEKPAAVATGNKPWDTPAFQQWMTEVAAMPAEEQVEAVTKKMVELNPGFDGVVTPLYRKWQPKIENGVVTEIHVQSDVIADIYPLRVWRNLNKLTLFGDSRQNRLSDLSQLSGLRLSEFSVGWSQVADISPLKDMPLKVLVCGAFRVSDLSPLANMQLTHLDCTGIQVSDLSPLKGMPLKFLNCSGTKVDDLSPLRGMKLTALNCSGTSVSDLSPLKGVPLTFLNCSGTKVNDLSPLRGMKLNALHLQSVPASDLSPLEDVPLKELLLDFKPERDTELLRSIKTLEKINGKSVVEFWKEVDGKSGMKPLAFQTPGFDQWIKDVQAMPAEKQVEAVSKKLVELNPGFDGKVEPRNENSMVVEFGFSTEHVTDISPVRALINLKYLKCKTDWPKSGSLVELSPLRGLALTTLSCRNNQISDLSPLREMPLKIVDCMSNKICDLSPLQGKELTYLECQNNQIPDLSPLRRMPMTSINFADNPVSDLSPLSEMPLTSLAMMGTRVTDLKLLKGLRLECFHCSNTSITDITPLDGMKLKIFGFTPTTVTRGIEIVRRMDSLEQVGAVWSNMHPPAEFWKKYDDGEFGKPTPQPQ